MSFNTLSGHDSFRSTSTDCSVQKKLRFGRIEIFNLPIELGDNTPSEGAPITLGWKADNTCYTYVNIHEALKDAPRPEYELRLSEAERASRLVLAGYSLGQIRQATEEAQTSRKEREVSSQQPKWRQKATRKMRKIMCGGQAA
jgi:hypothetical protein